MSTEEVEAADKLEHAWAIEAIPDLISICEQAEGYAKLWYANAIWGLSKSIKLDENIRQKAIETSVKAWQSLVEGNFSIPERFRKKISNIPLIQKTTPENYVVN